eukprot:1194943-Prorocentrum_minimum.AAC.2
MDNTRLGCWNTTEGDQSVQSSASGTARSGQGMPPRHWPPMRQLASHDRRTEKGMPTMDDLTGHRHGRPNRSGPRETWEHVARHSKGEKHTKGSAATAVDGTGRNQRNRPG